MRLLLMGILLSIPIALMAQDEVIKKLRIDVERPIKKEADTSSKSWKRGALLGVNISK